MTKQNISGVACALAIAVPYSLAGIACGDSETTDQTGSQSSGENGGGGSGHQGGDGAGGGDGGRGGDGAGGVGAQGGMGGDGGSAFGGMGGDGGQGGAAAICGDAMISNMETCDDGDAMAGDGCDDACQTEAGWSCMGEPSVCSATCGDGLVRGSEGCDDMNTTALDGCDGACAVEMGYSCMGEPSVCVFTCGDGTLDASENCDDNNLANGDGCSSVCQVEVTETEPNDTSATANAAIDPFIAVFDPAGDQDFLQIPVSLNGAPSATVRLVTIDLDQQFGNGDMNTGSCTGLSLDTVVSLFDTDGVTSLGSDDDGGPGLCSDLSASVPTDGTYFAQLNEFDNDDVRGYATVVTIVPEFFPCAAGQTFVEVNSSDTPLPISETTPTISVVNVAAVGTVRRTMVRYNELRHTYNDDLDVFLIAPDATRVELHTDIGGFSDDMLGTLFDDTCQVMPDLVAEAPFSGCYAPEGTLGSLIGSTASGNWTLEISDDAPGDQGTLESWTLGLCVQ